MHKSLLLIVSFFLFNISLSLLYSCNKDEYDDGCGGPFISKYCGTLKNISVTPLRVRNDGYSYDTVSSSETVRYYELGLMITLMGEKSVCMRSARNPFLNTAYACTPPIPLVDYQGTIERVSITCDKDFNKTHPAGTDIKEYFELYGGGTDQNKVEYDGSSGGIHRFILKERPDNGGTYIFTVTYHLAGGSIIQDSTQKINLQN